jgi:non-canonical poly(A) RNA polymerase PAPD5/7
MQYVHNKNVILKNTVSKVKQLLEESVQNCLGKNYEVKIYGSRETGLCLPWSDIDAVISFSENKYMDPLNILYIYLLNNFSFVNIKYIENTQIPLIKIITTNEFYNISLDISLELPEHHGAECVSYIKEKIKEYEVLTPLTLALKTIFQKGKLNEPYIGGLSSYGIILIIINFLKIKQKEGKDISLKNLGKLFYELLVFYGKQYDINSPIDVNGKDENDIIPLTNNTNGLIIVDPLNKYNNVAKNVRQFMNIRFALNIAIASIYESCECGCHYQYEGLCIKEEGCNHNLLNNIFNSVKRN